MPNVSAGNKTLCFQQHVARELRVKRSYSTYQNCKIRKCLSSTVFAIRSQMQNCEFLSVSFLGYQTLEDRRGSTFLCNSLRFPKKHCFVAGSQASAICPSSKSVKTSSTGHLSSEPGMVTPKCPEKNLSQGQFVHQKFHMNWTGTEPGSPRWQTGNFTS